MQSARLKAADIARCRDFSHDACGLDVRQRFADTGYFRPDVATHFGENLAWGGAAGRQPARLAARLARLGRASREPAQAGLDRAGHRARLRRELPRHREQPDLGLALRPPGLGGSGERAAVPPGRAARPQAASSIAPVSQRIRTLPASLPGNEHRTLATSALPPDPPRPSATTLPPNARCPDDRGPGGRLVGRVGRRSRRPANAPGSRRSSAPTTTSRASNAAASRTTRGRRSRVSPRARRRSVWARSSRR